MLAFEQYCIIHHKPFIEISINLAFYSEVAYKCELSNSVIQLLTI